MSFLRDFISVFKGINISISQLADAIKEYKTAAENIARASEQKKLPDATEEAISRQRKEPDGWQKASVITSGLTAVFTALAFLAAAIYACVAHRQLRTMNETYSQIQQQTTLMRQQLAGTMGAVIEVSEISHEVDDYWQINFSNFGKVIAPRLDMKWSLIHQELPSGKRIGVPQEFSFTYRQMRPTLLPQGDPKIIQKFRTKGYTDTSPALVSGHERFRIYVTLSYHNGFEDVPPFAVCWETKLWVPTKVTWDICKQ